MLLFWTYKSKGIENDFTNSISECFEPRSRYGLRKLPSFVSDEYFQADHVDLIHNTKIDISKEFTEEDIKISNNSNRMNWKNLNLDEKTSASDSKDVLQPGNNVQNFYKAPEWRDVTTPDQKIKDRLYLNLEEEMLCISFLEGYHNSINERMDTDGRFRFNAPPQGIPQSKYLQSSKQPIGQCITTQMSTLEN